MGKIPALVVLLGCANFCGLAGEPLNPDPASFDKNHNGVLEVDELRRYVITRDKLTPDPKVFLNDDGTLKPDAPALIEKNLFEKADFRLGGLYTSLHLKSHDPIPVDILRKRAERAAEKAEQKPIQIPGVFAESIKLTNHIKGSVGPFLLRKSADDWHTDLQDVEGAKVSYSDNRESHQSTWSSQGALIYPVVLSEDFTDENREHGILSERWLLLPSTSWNVNKTGASGTNDLEELQWQVPVVWSMNHVGLGWLRNSELSLMPYALTDFSFKGLVAGLTFSYTPYLLDDHSGFGINTGYKGLGRTFLLYQLGLVPSLDYNHLASTSRFITRTAHANYFRGGAKLEAGLLTKGYPALETLVSYQPWFGFSGAPDYRYLLSLSGKLWLNRFVGFTVDYQRGETPVAQQDVDLLTAGLELKF